MSETRVISYKIEVDDAPVKSLKLQLREAKEEAQRLATAEVIDQAALEKAIQKTAELQDAMADVNEQVAVFASGSKYEQASNALGQVKDAIFALDFGKAQERAAAFATAAKTINFGDAIKSVKELGSTFLTIGKAILTNPIFLLAAVIAGIVYVVYKLLDALGVIRAAMEALGKVVSFITDLFYSLTDALGLTDKAAEESLKKSVELAEKKSEALTLYSTQMEAAIANELKLLRARDDGSEESANKIIAAERRLVREKQAAAKEQFKLAESVLLMQISTGKATKEELDAQKKKVFELRQAFKAADADAKAFDLQQQTNAKKKADADNKASEEQAKKDGEKAAAERARRIEAAKKKEEDDKRIAEQERVAAIQRARFIEDVELSMIVGEEQRSDAIAKIRIQRAKDDLDLTKYTEEQKALILKSFDDQITAVDTSRMELNAAKQAEELQTITEQYNEWMYNSVTDRAALAQRSFDEELAQIKSFLDAKLLSEEEYNEKKKALENVLSDEIKAIEQERVNAAIQMQQVQRDNAISAATSILAAVSANAAEGSTAAKAAAIAQTTIDTYLAAQKAYTSQLIPGDPTSVVRAVIAAASAVAIGIANVRKIVAVKTPGGGGGGSMPSASFGGGSPQLGSASQTPNINMFQNQPTQNQQTNIVSVVDYTDIRKKQNQVQVLENAVSLGL